MSFHEVQFPTDISLGSSSSPEWRTEIVSLSSGYEQRNSRWAHSRRKFNAGYGIKNLNQISEVLDFFEQRKGRFFGFRYKDGADHKSCRPLDTISAKDQLIAIGDSSKKKFQLIKTYGKGDHSYKRIITKPINNKVLISIDDDELIEGKQFECDYTKGIITFNDANIPDINKKIYAGFEFDTAARFDSDNLEINISSFNAGSIPNIPIIEILI